MEDITMKKALYLTAAVLAFAGCAKEPVTSPAESETAGTVVSFTASLDGLKTTFNKTDGYAWRENESVSVGTGNGEYVSFNCSDTENGVFTHTFAGTAPELLVAVSPAQSGTFTSAENYQVTLPSSYTFDRRTTNALLIGTPVESDGDNQRFEFKHAAALLRVTYQNVPVGTKGFWFGANTNITGTVSLTGTDVADVEIKNDNAGLTGTGVTINFAETTSEKDMTFYIPVPTGSYTEFQMNLWGDDSSIAESTKKGFYGTFNIARGEVKELPAVTLASNFTPYTVGATDNTTAWWGAFSQSYQVPEGKTLHLEFYNYSSKSNNETWHNWTAIFSTVALGQDPYSEHLALRADYWGWTPAGDFNTLAGLREKGTDTNLMGDDFVNLMDGAYVTMSLKNDNGVMRFKSVSTPAAESDRAKTRTITFDMEISGDLYLFLTTDLSHFDIKKVWYSGYKAEEEEDITFVGYRSAYDYYIYDTPLDMDVIGTPKRIVAAYSDGSTTELTAADFTFTAGQTLAASAGDQVFTATYKGETVDVTIPVKMGTGAFGSTTLVTSELAFSPFFGDVPSGESVSKTMFVYSSCTNNWASPCADAASTGFGTFYISVRMDNYGWGLYWDAATKESNWNWDIFEDMQNHDKVTITWTLKNTSQCSIRFDAAYWNGENHYQLYDNISTSSTLAYRSFTENSYVVVID